MAVVGAKQIKGGGILGKTKNRFLSESGFSLRNFQRFLYFISK